MKQFLILLLLALAAPLLVATSRGADPAGPAEYKRVLDLAKAVQAQQLVIAENQGKIDNKIVAIMEQIRLARIYSSRTGK